MSNLAIIGGTGLTTLKNLKITKRERVQTPYGEPSTSLIFGELAGIDVLFLPRHGDTHTIPPHKINYRANIWALNEVGVKNIIAVAAVGGIRADMVAQRLVIPDQLIDYTGSRINTFFEEGLSHVTHIDFSEPYSAPLRDVLIEGCQVLGFDAVTEGTYAATQGPRLETVAEINRLERDGCDIVGMTGMPEAALARELNIPYAAIAVVANLAAGRSTEDLTMEMIERNLAASMESIRTLLTHVIPKI